MKKTTLDDEGKDILESYERGEWVPVKNARRKSRGSSSMRKIHCKKTKG
jgi:hypothetical protein